MSCISFSYFRRRRCMVGWIPNIVSLVVGKLSDKSSELWLTRELAILYCHRWGILWSRCCRVFLCRSTGRNSCCCDWLREDRPIWQYKYTNINRNTNTKIYVVQMWKYSITQINIHKFLCRSSGGNSWHRCDWLRQMDRHSQTEQCEDISDTSKYIFVTVCVQCNCKVTSYTLHIYIQVYSDKVKITILNHPFSVHFVFFKMH